jgi:hypothetical protein
MRILLIDDLRTFNGIDVIARNYYEGIRQLEINGPWDMLYLDHDLGGARNNSYSTDLNREMTGYDILCWLEEHREFLPKEIILVTDNAVGRQKMQPVIDNLYSK